MKDDKEQKAREWRKIGIAFGASWIVVSSILVSALVGLGLDRLLHTGRLFLVISFVVGVAAGLYSLIREVRRME
jgi:F0F1-type ATP synthase assembly protein I